MVFDNRHVVAKEDKKLWRFSAWLGRQDELPKSHLFSGPGFHGANFFIVLRQAAGACNETVPCSRDSRLLLLPRSQIL